MEIGSTTRLIVLLGNPVRHSLSPGFQNAAIRAAGLNAVYLALRCDGDHLEGLLRGIAEAGGGGNVTVPHKERAARLLDVRTPAVEQTGACNTFWATDGRLHGDNTDVEGFAAAARALIGPPAGSRVLVLGAGGAARAAVLALLGAPAETVHVLARTPARARALRDDLDAARVVVVVEEPSALQGEEYDLVVNATPLGLHPDDDLPLDLDQPAHVGAVLDLACYHGPTPWLRAARVRQIPAADGRHMLIRQGAAAFRRWFGRDPDLDVMLGALPPLADGQPAGP